MLRAIIFDMDGVICDSEKLHMQAFQSILQEEGMVLTDNEYYTDYLAFDDRGCFTKVFAKNGRALDSEKLKALVQRKRRNFEEMMKDHLVIYPGVDSFIKKAADRYTIGLASGASRLEVEYVLKKAKVRGMFTAIVSADDVQKGKPDPESFQSALKIINEWRLKDTPEIKPAECLVIEDSLHGIAAAHAAGMRCCAVPTSYKKEQLGQADQIIDSFVGLELQQLERLFV